MKLQEIRRKILAPRDGEETQEINDIPVIEERIRNENGPVEPNETEIRVHVETEITDEEHLIIDELNAFMTRNERQECLPFKKADQRNLRDVTKKLNGVIRHIETDNGTQTNKHAIAATLRVAKEVGVKKKQNRSEKRAMIEKKN